jgi:hypothetical protein
MVDVRGLWLKFLAKDVNGDEPISEVAVQLDLDACMLLSSRSEVAGVGGCADIDKSSRDGHLSCRVHR